MLLRGAPRDPARHARSGGVRLGRALLLTVCAALPWTWFLLRDRTGAVGDLLAILLPAVVLVVVLIGVAVARQRRGWWLPTASVLAVGLAAVLGPWLPADAGAVRPGAAITVVGANVMGRASTVPSLLAQSPDVLVVSEMAPGLAPALAAAYPYRYLVSGGPEVGVYSRLPMRVLDGARPDLPGVRAVITGPSGPFVLFALHVPRPWFTTRGGYQATVEEHHQIMNGLARQVAAETLPVVVVGDLNSPDRGRDYRQILGNGRLVDAMRDRATTFTSIGKWTPLIVRIDHLLVSRGWCGDAAEHIDLPGSDHSGVTAAVGPCLGAPGS